ncbi:MAG: serine/threonine protein phosphatase [Lachnospiraceae bacterium]|nr:serine/threonine protein phosphatase [Lachnospiraceae bacterium]
MSYYSRLQKAFEGAIRLPLNHQTKYVLFSDCHRGTGTSNDNFLKNQTLHLATLQYYFKTGYTYIELGDGDELWENRCMEQIIEAHNDIFRLLSLYDRHKRLYMLYGNHDMVKKNTSYTAKPCTQTLFADMKFHESIILENNTSQSARDIYLTHGHQADLLNSVFWRFARFLVRYVWKPLEYFGVMDPTSAAKNYTRKQKTELRLQDFAEKEGHIIITGHTHRPVLSETDSFYCNCGSCVHPYSITCIEIERMHISLAKWALAVRSDMSLYVAREILAGPFPLR